MRTEKVPGVCPTSWIPLACDVDSQDEPPVRIDLVGCLEYNDTLVTMNVIQRGPISSPSLMLPIDSLSVKFWNPCLRCSLRMKLLLLSMPG